MYSLLCLAILLSPLHAAEPPKARITETEARTEVATESPAIRLTLDWLHAQETARDFTTAPDEKTGITTTSQNLDGTHLTRTIVATPEAIYIHCLVDKPGAISFRATLHPPAESGGVTLEDRRELAWQAAEGGAKARVWVIPFESDVEADGGSILLRGEGECLIVLAVTDAENPGAPLADTWKRISAKHDPGQNPPDPVKIWQAISAAAGAP